jgi:hypothetical protein
MCIRDSPKPQTPNPTLMPLFKIPMGSVQSVNTTIPTFTLQTTPTDTDNRTPLLQ